ncbi:hypothetical protein CRENBAI_000158 [Crenichthys baileyi]|uniref:Uncharacterized protein n=1 Tax=Crenichthys baileyi TaxID=28760 RepID=A0AAV9R093_9TELE
MSLFIEKLGLLTPEIEYSNVFVSLTHSDSKIGVHLFPRNLCPLRETGNVANTLFHVPEIDSLSHIDEKTRSRKDLDL